MRKGELGNGKRGKAEMGNGKMGKGETGIHQWVTISFHRFYG
jgi:hypothetical protein